MLPGVGEARLAFPGASAGVRSVSRVMFPRVSCEKETTNECGERPFTGSSRRRRARTKQPRSRRPPSASATRCFCAVCPPLPLFLHPLLQRKRCPRRVKCWDVSNCTSPNISRNGYVFLEGISQRAVKTAEGKTANEPPAHFGLCFASILSFRHHPRHQCGHSLFLNGRNESQKGAVTCTHVSGGLITFKHEELRSPSRAFVTMLRGCCASPVAGGTSRRKKARWEPRDCTCRTDSRLGPKVPSPWRQPV